MRTELGRSQVEVQRCARGPAVRTELGRSQVEVRQCALSWEGPRLSRKLAKSLAKGWQGGSGGGS